MERFKIHVGITRKGYKHVSNRQLTRGRSAPLHAFSVRAQDNGGRDKESTLLPQHLRPVRSASGSFYHFCLLSGAHLSLPRPVQLPSLPLVTLPGPRSTWWHSHVPTLVLHLALPSRIASRLPPPSIGTGGRPTSLLLNQTTPFHEQLPRHRAAAATVHCPTCSCPPAPSGRHTPSPASAAVPGALVAPGALTAV